MAFEQPSLRRIDQPEIRRSYRGERAEHGGWHGNKADPVCKWQI